MSCFRRCFDGLPCDFFERDAFIKDSHLRTDSGRSTDHAGVFVLAKGDRTSIIESFHALGASKQIIALQQKMMSIFFINVVRESSSGLTREKLHYGFHNVLNRRKLAVRIKLLLAEMRARVTNGIVAINASACLVQGCIIQIRCLHLKLDVFQVSDFF